MPTRTNPLRLRAPALRGAVIVDTFRGKVRIRKWPKKRSKNKPAHTAYMNAWFADAAKKIKRVPGPVVQASMNQAKGTGLYPRDVILSMMANNPYVIPLGNGKWSQPAKLGLYEVAFQGARLQLTATQVLTLGIFDPITWPMPLIDTAGFFNPTTPDRLVIPPGVNIVNLTAQIQTDGSATNVLRTQIRDQAGTTLGEGRTVGMSFPVIDACTGPMRVAAGDYFRLGGFCTATCNAQIIQTFLCLEVLDAQIPPPI